ncbi:MAG: response regulator transcription factor [Firmicutes bacterium]|nr:response regulator transcription factor [Bacillota bacterium]
MHDESTPRLLLVEDDPIISSGLIYAFEQAGYIAAHAKDIETAKALSLSFDLAVLDIGLPDGSGFDLVESLKSAGVSLIFLTAIDEEGHIIRAFEVGAEDYVTKPFRMGELMARVKAVLRRRHGLGDVLVLGDIRIHTNEGKALLGDTPLDLTALEYRLLLTFATNKRQVLSRGQILNHLWDAAGQFVEDNTLTVYIKRLRAKIGSGANIETVKGMGYKANDN